jgi:hypothetical protein
MLPEVVCRSTAATRPCNTTIGAMKGWLNWKYCLLVLFFLAFVCVDGLSSSTAAKEGAVNLVRVMYCTS